MVQIITSLPAIFHLAAHFESLSPTVIDFLMQEGFTIEAINQALEKPGSKFYSFFAKEFKTIQDQLCDAQIKENISENGNIIRVAVFNKEKYPNGIGSAGVIAIKALDKTQRDQLKKVRNRGIALWQLSVEQLPATNTLSLITRKENEVENLITCYPGEPGMPVPNDSMPTLFYDQCKRYWEEHAFLVHG